MLPSLIGKVVSGRRLNAYHALAPRSGTGVVTDVTVAPEALTLNINESAKLTASVLPAETNPSVIWESSDPDIAIVHPDGSVIALKSGSATITARSHIDLTKSASVSVTVTNNVSNVIQFLDFNFKQGVVDTLKAIDAGLYSNYSVYSNIYPDDVRKITELELESKNINNMEGLRYFTNLESLNCSFNSLKELDISDNTALAHLDCHDNKLISLDVSNNTALTYLGCQFNELIVLNVSDNTALTKLECGNGQLISLDVSKNLGLIRLDCGNNHLTSLDVSKNPVLIRLDCGSNRLTSLDVSKNTELTRLNCGNNRLTILDVSKNTELNEFFCEANQLISLDMRQNTVLTLIDCRDNRLAHIKANIGGGNINVTANIEGYVGLYYDEDFLYVTAVSVYQDRFDYWAQSDGQITKRDQYDLKIGQDYDLTANFIAVRTVTVTFDNQGGSNTEPVRLAINNRLQPPNPPTRENYNFDGWYKEPTCQNIWNLVTDIVTDDITLYAKWTRKAYSIVFDSQVPGIRLPLGEYVPEPNVPERTGYTFGGWYKEPACQNVWDFTADKVTGNLVIYAKWITNVYTAITYNANGGAGSTARTLVYGGNLTFPLVSKTGYDFVGWFTSATGGSQVTTSTSVPMAYTTYYAHWRIKSFDVAFDSQGGSKMAGRKVNYNNAVGSLPRTVRSGYTLNGWYTAKTGGSKITANQKITTNDTYYAHWTVTTPAKPTRLAAKPAGKGKLKISWNRVSGATGYVIQRSTISGSKGFKTVKTITKGTTCAYINAKLKAGTVYYYRIKAVNKRGSVTKTSAYTSAKKSIV